MTKQDWFGIFYVSVWIIIWGSIGSVIDLPLLNRGIYLPGSIGQAITFTVTGMGSILLAILVFQRTRKLILQSSSDES